MEAEQPGDLLDQRGDIAEAESVGESLAQGDGLENFDLSLGPEAGKCGDLPRLAGGLEIGDGGDGEGFVECFDFFGAESLDIK